MEPIIQQVRNQQPLIHHLTNQVVMNFSANGLIAFGASPVMAKEQQEVRDMAAVSDGLLLNIGTLTESGLKAMIQSGQAANEQGIPVVVDPVGVAATPFRTNAIQQLFRHVRPTLIKGNPGEIAHLADIPWEVKGVDSIGGGNVQQVAQQAVDMYDTAVVVTGPVDVVHTGDTVKTNDRGHPYLSRITGSGCLLGSVITACLTAEGSVDQKMLSALRFYGLAAEYAADRPGVGGPGTFLSHFIDALALEPAALDE